MWSSPLDQHTKLYFLSIRFVTIICTIFPQNIPRFFHQTIDSFLHRSVFSINFSIHRFVSLTSLEFARLQWAISNTKLSFNQTKLIHLTTRHLFFSLSIDLTIIQIVKPNTKLKLNIFKWATNVTSSFNTLSRSQNISNYLIYWMGPNSEYAYTRCVVHLKSNWLLDWMFLSYLLWHTKQLLFNLGFLVRIGFISNTHNIHTVKMSIMKMSHLHKAHAIGMDGEWWVSSFPIGKLECLKIGRLYIKWDLFCFVYVYTYGQHMIWVGELGKGN